MRASMWTPLPPAKGGIADYSVRLLDALSKIVDVSAVAEEPELVTGVPVPVVRPADARGERIYHLGNHFASHNRIYTEVLAEPGVVVLHDQSLLYLVLHRHGGGHTPEFEEEVRYAHGPIRGLPDDPALLDGWPAVEADGVKYVDYDTLTMERRAVESAKAVIVHDPSAAARLRGRYPDVPVHVVPHGVTVHDDSGRAAVRTRLGWAEGEVVFGVFGSMVGIKRILVAVLAFAQVRRRWPNARLLLAGHPGTPSVLPEVERTIAEHGLADSVRIVASPAEAEFEELIGAADVVVNLRWPTAGETSGTMMRAFGAGRPVITSDLPQHRHLDPAFCRRIPIEPQAEAAELYRLFEHAMSWPEELRSAGNAAREWVREHATWEIAARGYATALDDVREPPFGASEPRHGVNVFADARATTGLSESARRHVQALAAAGGDLTFTEFNTRAPYRTVEIPPDIAALRRGKEFSHDLWMVNVNEWQLIPPRAFDRYTIALWAWELPEPPRHALGHLDRIDELWVLSSFVADAFRTATDIPITVVPSVVPQAPDVTGDRAKFGLPEDGLVVLFTFSASSSDARKNPWSLIEAFRRAFPADERGTKAHLVLKANNLERFPELDAQLSEAVASVNGTLLRREMSRADMDTLLATCDVYASLHRSEGFGLGIAEAMAMGKAVVATAFGGNVDFMLPGSAAPIGYDIRPITKHDHRFGAEFGDWYTVGQLWAEPDVDLAARWLRRLADSPRLRAEMGARAIEAIRETCSPEAVGAVMTRRLAELRAGVPAAG